MRKLILLLSCMLLLTACHERHSHFNGYIDADLIYLSGNYPGRLTELAVSRGALVDKDQLLFKLEDTSENYAVSMSELNQKALIAQRDQILDQIQYSETQYHRVLRLIKQHAASQSEVDAAKKDLDVLQNQLAAINSQIKSSEVNTATNQWQIRRKQSTAPEQGLIFDTYYTLGEYVQTGQPVISLVTRDNIKVVFFVPEAALSHIKLNDKVQVSTDGAPTLASGTVRYISNIAQYTPPIIYSREDRESLIFRVEAKIDAPDLTKIHLGQPVSLEFIS